MHYGRKRIFTDVEEVSKENISQVWNLAILEHEKNRQDISYLYSYYKGKQTILSRTKSIRPEINNKIVVNTASEIVDFKCGYNFGEPVQYVSRGSTVNISENINTLNGYMVDADKPSMDAELAFWFTVCGVAHRMVLPAKNPDADTPFEIRTLDPRNTFVVYQNDIAQTPIVAFAYVLQKDGNRIAYAYTKTSFYTLKNGQVVDNKSHTIGHIPIVEYTANKTRQGAFEMVLPLLDAINAVESNRLDGIEQFIQAIMVFENCAIDKETLETLREQGALQVRNSTQSPAKVYYLNEQLDQTQTQTLIDDLYKKVLAIVGMPSMSDGNTSDSSNNGAVILRQGWQLAEARAKQTELLFKKSERQFLQIVLRICREFNKLDLRVSDIEQKFTRRNYADLLTKSQTLTTMLDNDKINPEDAYAASGMFTDSVAAYQRGMVWYRSQQELINEPARMPTGFVSAPSQ